LLRNHLQRRERNYWYWSTLVARLISANGIGDALAEAKAVGATSDKLQRGDLK